jgi:hypothetical protein
MSYAIGEYRNLRVMTFNWASPFRVALDGEEWWPICVKCFSSNESLQHLMTLEQIVSRNGEQSHEPHIHLTIFLIPFPKRRWGTGNS